MNESARKAEIDAGRLISIPIDRYNELLKCEQGMDDALADAYNRGYDEGYRNGYG
jgi:hypothetical protein